MAEALEKARADYDAGFSSAYHDGIEEGFEKGIEEGIEKGKQEREIELAKDMLKDNEPIEKIIRYLRFDESTIIRLKTELDNE